MKLKVIGDVDVGLLPFLDDDPSVEFAGFVGDLRKEFGSAGLMVVPLRVGGGTRLKILEAMAVGVPVLSTSVGCEGIEASPGEHIAVADDWHEFADTAVNLLLDDQKRSTMAKKARGFVEAHYSWHQIAEDYERHLSRVLHFRG